MTASRSAFSCVFEYLKTPNLMPAVFQCLTAIVYRAFETAVSWLVRLFPMRLLKQIPLHFGREVTLALWLGLTLLLPCIVTTFLNLLETCLYLLTLLPK